MPAATTTPALPTPASRAPFTVLDRPGRERHEAATLSEIAVVACGAGDRPVPEDPDPLRTCFERDRDRILHSPAFRRLAGKTQVFVFPDDHQRTRLTHALEVAQVAAAIARACGLNVALTEAIALGHDCGHGPFGHASEDALSPYLPEGFDHAVWGADVVGRRLNLCRETLDGIRNHPWRRPPAGTAEGQVVGLADRIAYVCHDFEDAVRAGVVDRTDLPSRVARWAGRDRSSQVGAFVTSVVGSISAHRRVILDDEAAAVLDEFRAFNFERIYLRPDSVAEAQLVVSVLRALVEHLATDRSWFEEEPLRHEDDPLRSAVGYVAGMTDRFACRLACEALDWPIDQLPRGFGG